MDFYRFAERADKHGTPELYPEFRVGRSKDLMVRGRSFYAIWNEAANLWSTDEYDVQILVDAELAAEADKRGISNVKWLSNYDNQRWGKFKQFLKDCADNAHQLDERLIFANTEVKKTDYASRRLPYPLEPGDTSAWDEIMDTLYSPEERAKIEWAIGSIIAGDSKKIQKFLVLYGPAGTGKSTVLNIIQKLFEGYYVTFDAKALAGNNNAFATEVFKSNPLVAIQHDGDLSRIEDNTKINSIVSHEEMTMNEKYKPSYTSRVNAFLFMGTNQPVKISDAKSGIIRRLIDVVPTGNKVPPNRYHSLMAQIDFELGAIAHHCHEVYLGMGRNFYNAYRPLEMMFQTDVFFNYVEAYYDLFKEQDGVSLKQAYTLYKEFCSETGVDRGVLPQYKVREELKNYFDEFHTRHMVDGEVQHSYFHGFNFNKFKTPVKDDPMDVILALEDTTSLLDLELADQPAQYANGDIPSKRWATVKTTLSEIDTSQVHYVKVPENHIVIDFDLKDEDGNKSLLRNLKAATEWPPTYAELSKGGNGVHLHYIYDGDVNDLASVYSDGIEIKTLLGDSSLRRRLTKCNSVAIATINSGLPFKEKKMIEHQTMQSEKGLRDLIERNLRKEIHAGTKPSIDFIHKILEDAYESGMAFDVTDLRPRIVAFANNSTNQPLQALKVVQKMRWKSEEAAEPATTTTDDRLVFFDVEVYPNLFVVVWKFSGDADPVKMINPTPQDIEPLLRMKLVGFNNRRYDNHILYARYLGYDNEKLYKLSQRIINGNVDALFGEAYNISYTDIYDFSSKKQGLKKFEIELGVHHMEMDIPWDEPVPENKIDNVVEYCTNDVKATEVVFTARQQDFVARQILAELSGLTVNDTTKNHTARIIFGKEKNPQAKFIYTHLDTGEREQGGKTLEKDPVHFEGYQYDFGKSTYRGELIGEGGYVYAEPGIYENVALLDVASMHPTSIECLDLFGPYTGRFSELKDARLAIKHGQFDEAKKMLDGKLAPYLKDEADAKALSYALKIVINIVYGLTSAKFDNPFRDARNKDNIVAKRGALFMVDLKNAVQAKGFTVAHVKTDSIKIPDATPEIIEFVMEFGRKYGYTFEHEATYEKFCLVNDAVYIAKYDGHWEAVGAQFQHPYVFKTLFSHEPITFEDFCETKQVTKGHMVLDFDAVQKPMASYHGSHFVGRTGRFLPVTPESGGGLLYRVVDDKKYAVAGTKDHVWVESEIAKAFIHDIDLDDSYYENLVDDAKKTIEKFGSFDDLVK